MFPVLIGKYFFEWKLNNIEEKSMFSRKQDRNREKIKR
jgi:hypothetical protein